MSTVEELLEAVKELRPEQKDELKHRLMALWLLWETLTSNSATTDRSLLRYDALLNAPTVKNRQPRKRHPPIEIKGKLISETVIEGRRLF
jgi:hypothetical protein